MVVVGSRSVAEVPIEVLPAGDGLETVIQSKIDSKKDDEVS